MHRLQHIYEIDELPRLKEFLLAIPDGERLREDLFAEFARYCCYRDAEEWNRAVCICECLAIVGWGEREPLEAVRGTYFNGNPNTYFLNRDSRPRCFDAVWSKEWMAIQSISVARNGTTARTHLSELRNCRKPGLAESVPNHSRVSATGLPRIRYSSRAVWQTAMKTHGR